MRHNKLPAESDGKTVRLSCAPGISVASATYGGNCGAPQGNATYDVASSCYGKVDCQYTVSPNGWAIPLVVVTKTLPFRTLPVEISDAAQRTIGEKR